MRKFTTARWVTAVSIAIATSTGLLAALSCYVAIRVKSDFTRAINSAATEGGLTVRDLHYHRGWLSSVANVTFVPRSLPIGIQSQYRLHYGLLPSRSSLWPSLSQAAIVHATYSLRTIKSTPPDLAAQLTRVPSGQMDMVAGYNGNITGHFGIPLGQIQTASGTLRWSAVSGSIQFKEDGSHLSLNATIPTIEFHRPRLNVNLQGLGYSSEVLRDATGMVIGRRELSAKSISVRGAISLKKVKAESTSRIKEGLLAITLRSALGAATLRGKPVGSAVISLHADHLESGALLRFENEVDALVGQPMPREQKQMILFGRVLQLAGSLFRHNPEVDINKLRCATPYGKLSGDAHFTVRGSDQDISADPMLLMTATAGNATLSVPKAVLMALIKNRIQRDMDSLLRNGTLSEEDAARLTPKTVDTITEKAYPAYLRSYSLLRYFRADGNRYVLRLVLNHGTIRINGKTINPVSLSSG